MSDTNEEPMYLVVMNSEEQYSPWPATKCVPSGWHAVGEAASKEACIEYIEAHWTDMRPLGLRAQLARHRDGAS